MKLTPGQEKAVVTEGRDIAILAGAGSGKTRVLVERTAHLALRDENPLPLSSFLAITFTEKAAREMKQRLAARFAESDRPEARAEVEWAWVATIHGFCSRLLRENAVEAGVDPAFRVLDAAQSSTLLREVLADVAEARSASHPEEHEAVLRLGVSEPRLVDELLDFLETLRTAGVAPREAPVPPPEPAALREEIAAIVAAVEGLAPLLAAAPAKSREKAETALAALPPLRDLAGADDPPFAAVREALEAFAGAVNLSLSKDLKEVLKPVKQELVPAAIRTAAEAFARPSLLALRELLAAVDEEYTARKDELGVLDFSDLERRTLALLESSEEVRETIRSRFAQILVDEYQDVNPVQARIVGRIRGEGNHFAVGDVKQSIYGFRGAEPSIFAARAEEAGEEGRIVLPENFRSTPGLVEFANHCFSRLFAGDRLVAWTDMVAAADYELPEAPEVEVLLTGGENAREAREAEATAIARRIRRLVDGEELPLGRAGERRGRPARFGDVAVLFRALTDVKTYERAFEELDVPFYVVKGRGFFQAREMIDLIRLLRTVANPRDEVSLAAALRSPFGGMTDDGLLALAAARRGGGGCLADLLESKDGPEGLGDRDREAWGRFAALHGRLRRRAARGTLRSVVETALEESGYGTAVWLQRGGRRRAANLRKALPLADSFEGLFDLPAFLAALEDFRAREVRETEAPTGGEQEDVVRILTIHAAKGLEFPVVFLPDLGRKPVVQAPPLLLGAERIAARIAEEPGASPCDTAGWYAEKEARASREAAERLRLLYVAVTRAEERLVLSARDDAPGTGSFQEVLGTVLDFGADRMPFGPSGRFAEVIRPGRERPPTRRITVAGPNLERLAKAEPLTPPPEEHRRRARELLARADRPRPPAGLTAYENTVSELLQFADCRACWYERYALGLREEWEEPAPDEGDGTAPGADELPPNERGSLVHEVLRLHDPHGSDPLEDLVARRTGDDPRLAADVLAMVRSFYESDAGAEVLAAPPERVRREVPFLVRWPVPGRRLGLLFRGQLDLLYPRPDGALRILDYKTGGPGRAYEIQLAAYARALREMDGGEVQAALVYLRPDRPAREETIALGPELSARVEAEAAAFAACLESGTRPTEHTCVNR